MLAGNWSFDVAFGRQKAVTLADDEVSFAPRDLLEICARRASRTTSAGWARSRVCHCTTSKPRWRRFCESCGFEPLHGHPAQRDAAKISMTSLHFRSASKHVAW